MQTKAMLGALNQVQCVDSGACPGEKNIAAFASTYQVDLPVRLGTSSPSLAAFVPDAPAAAVHKTNPAEDAKRLPKNCPRLELASRGILELSSTTLLSTRDWHWRAAAGRVPPCARSCVRPNRCGRVATAGIFLQLEWNKTAAFEPAAAYAFATGHTTTKASAAIEHKRMTGGLRATTAPLFSRSVDCSPKTLTVSKTKHAQSRKTPISFYVGLSAAPWLVFFESYPPRCFSPSLVLSVAPSIALCLHSPLSRLQVSAGWQSLLHCCSWCRRVVDSMVVGRCWAGLKRSMRAAVMTRRLVMAIFLLACLAGRARVAGGASAEVVNTQVQRKIDVSTQFAKVSFLEGTVAPAVNTPSLALCVFAATYCRHLSCERLPCTTIPRICLLSQNKQQREILHCCCTSNRVPYCK